MLPTPFVVRDVRAHAVSPTRGPSDQVLETYPSGGGTRVVSAQTATQVRSAMVDAVQGELGRLYAGAGSVANFGISGVMTAGKTGTAELGPDVPPHSCFIGFVPRRDGYPAIAVAVIVERRRLRLWPCGADRRSGHGAWLSSRGRLNSSVTRWGIVCGGNQVPARAVWPGEGID